VLVARDLSPISRKPEICCRFLENERSVADFAVLVSDGEHGAVDAAVAAALRGDAVAARDVQGQVRLVGAHDHRRWIRLRPPLPATPHCALPLLVPVVFTFVCA
jgi:hypothetical protein